MKKQKIVLLVGGLILIVVLSFILGGDKKSLEQQVSMGEPTDIVSDFYTQWITASKSEDTDPYKSGLSESSILSPELRGKIESIKKDSENNLDPVLCQTTSDIDIATRRIFEKEDEVQILVTAKDKTLTGQAVITLLKYKEGWFINDITCSPGEFAEDREFTFNREGFLLKGSVENSLNPDLWYIIFEENGEAGHSAPFIFSSESKCLDKKGEEFICALYPFKDLAKVSIQGEMTERGIDVKNFLFI